MCTAQKKKLRKFSIQIIEEENENFENKTQ